LRRNIIGLLPAQLLSLRASVTHSQIDLLLATPAYPKKKAYGHEQKNRKYQQAAKQPTRLGGGGRPLRPIQRLRLFNINIVQSGGVPRLINTRWLGI
jgi:hypothetical protein